MNCVFTLPYLWRMYNSAQFKEDDEQQVLAFMRAHPFAMLIGSNNGRAVATQVPLMIEEREGKLLLTGHITRKQDHQLVFEENAEALVVFTGAHAYVSATWYENPQMVSTWNYSSVHVRGKLSFLNEEGLEFTKRYYKHGIYTSDYQELLGMNYDSLYEIPDTPENYHRIAAQITKEFEKWKSKRAKKSWQFWKK